MVRAMSGLQLFKRLISLYVLPHKRRLVFAVLCMCVVAGATATNAWLMQPIINKVFIEKNETLLWIISGAVLGIAIVKGIADYGQDVLMKYVGQRIVTDLQLSLYEHLLYADIAFFNQSSSGKLISHFSNDIYLIRLHVVRVITGLAKELLTLIGLIGVMLYQSVTLSLIALVAFPIAILPMRRLARHLRKISRNTQQTLGDYTNQLDDTFQGIRVVKSFTNETLEMAKARTTMEKIFALYQKAARLDSASSPVMEIFGGLAIASVVAYGGLQVIQGTTSAGSFFSFITALLLAYRPAKALSKMNIAFQETSVALQRIFGILDTKPAIKDSDTAVPLKITEGRIVMEDISYRYPEQDRPALAHINLRAEGGQRIALVGPSGGGKTTLVQLLMRFYDPASGRILIDGQNIQDVTLHSLRHHIAFVTQDVTLFDDSVAANIAYGSPGASEEEILEAAYNAAAHDFITDLPQGYKTLIGNRGVKLSGGQRQRLAIARAMLKNAPILILDEATSALDNISEQQVQQALERLMKNRTTIIIAHRLSTIEHADQIFVLKAGKIVEHGRHADLISRGGEYTRLHARGFREAA